LRESQAIRILRTCQPDTLRKCENVDSAYLLNCSTPQTTDNITPLPLTQTLHPLAPSQHLLPLNAMPFS
jgi:hypothetical protein